MKKIIALFMTALMVVSLAACAGSENTAETQPATTTAAVETAVSETEAPVGEYTITRGTVSENVYTNEFVGITFTAPDSWSFYDEEELAELIGSSAEALGSDVAESLEQVPSLFDMMAVEAGGSSVNVVYEKNTFDLDVDAYMDSFESQLEAMEGTVVARGRSNLGDVSFATMDYSIVDAVTQRSYVTVIGNYVVSICIGVTGDYTLDEIAACFS